MVQKIHPWGVIWVPDFGPRELLSKCSILEPSLNCCIQTGAQIWMTVHILDHIWNTLSSFPLDPPILIEILKEIN